jgi:hypothetical protein
MHQTLFPATALQRNIKFFMDALNIPDEWISSDTGHSVEEIQSFQNKDRRGIEPTVDTVIKIAASMGIDPMYLVMFKPMEGLSKEYFKESLICEEELLEVA